MDKIAVGYTALASNASSRAIKIQHGEQQNRQTKQFAIQNSARTSVYVEVCNTITEAVKLVDASKFIGMTGTP